MLNFPRPTCVVLDFDFTLTKWKSSFAGLLEIFTSRGVPLAAVTTVWQEAEKTGFSIHLFQRLVEQTANVKFGEKSVRQDFDNWMETNLCLYPDAIHFLDYCDVQGLPIAIVTRGFEPYQREKLARVKVRHTAFFCTTKAFTKHLVLEQLLAQYGSPIVFVEDRAKELDTCRLIDPGGEKIITILIKRGDSPHNQEEGQHSHHTIADLTNINFAGRY